MGGYDWIGFVGAHPYMHRMLDLLTDYPFLYCAADVALIRLWVRFPR